MYPVGLCGCTNARLEAVADLLGVVGAYLIPTWRVLVVAVSGCGVSGRVPPGFYAAAGCCWAARWWCRARRLWARQMRFHSAWTAASPRRVNPWMPWLCLI